MPENDDDDEFSLGWHRGVLTVVYYEDGRRIRRSLGTSDRATAKALLKTFATEYRKAKKGNGGPMTVAAIWEAYVADREEDKKVAVTRMRDAWKRLAPSFGSLLPALISKHLVKDYITSRRKIASNGTIHLELTYLRAALTHAAKANWIDKAPLIPLPQRPKPRDHFLTKTEALRLLEHAHAAHVRLFIALALTTAGRMSAILELEWSRVNLERRLIDLRVPDRDDTPKGRALVPINDFALRELERLRPLALSDSVIEYGGEGIANIKKGLKAAGARAGLKVSAHVLRHSAAVWMAEGGRPLEEIAQYLGHTSTATTFRVYAKYSPDYLKKTASTLEL